MTEERTTWTTGSFTTNPNRIAAADTVPGLVLVYSRVHESISSAVPLEGTLVTIGREGDNTVSLRESAVSRYHARIERRDSSCSITDCGSTNGTLVNGRRIESVTLYDQDIVRIGDTVFRFASTHAHRYTAYRITGEKDLARCPPHGILDPLIIGGMQVDLTLDQIAKVARTTLSIVVHGESGTGKELVARELHRWSGRRGTFQAINCAAIPSNLLESELFGYRRGAFTGATTDKIGLVQAAQGGTVFLDEIGDMPLEAQAKLLRVLQEREVTPVGSTQAVRVDVRFVAATHRNLETLVAEGRFRGDLLARLREAQLTLPPLRARREDLYRLVLHFLHRAGSTETNLGVGYMLALAHYDFPYNVRELESAVRLSLALAQGEPLDVRHLPTIIQQALEAQTSEPGAVTSPSRPAPMSSTSATGMHAPSWSPAPLSAPPHVAAMLGSDPRSSSDASFGRSVHAGGHHAGSQSERRARGDEPTTAQHTKVVSAVALASTWRIGDVESDEARAQAADARTPPPSEAELRGMLARHQGNVAAVGRELGKERMQIHRWMKRYGITPDDYRG